MLAKGSRSCSGSARTLPGFALQGLRPGAHPSASTSLTCKSCSASVRGAALNRFVSTLSTSSRLPAARPWSSNSCPRFVAISPSSRASNSCCSKKRYPRPISAASVCRCSSSGSCCASARALLTPSTGGLTLCIKGKKTKSSRSSGSSACPDSTRARSRCYVSSDTSPPRRPVPERRWLHCIVPMPSCSASSLKTMSRLCCESR
jgi:hypothetical protein